MDKKLVLLIFVFLLIFLTFTGSLFLSHQNRNARATNRIPVANTSLCLAEKLAAKVSEPVQVTCVARDDGANAVPGAQCCISVTSGSALVSPNCSTTDNAGMSKSIVTTSTAETSQINCVINGSINAGSVSVAFSQ